MSTPEITARSYETYRRDKRGERRANASWSSVLCGVVTFFAVSLLLGTLGTALGFGMMDPMSSTPMAGVGATFGIWSGVTIIISLACGAFVAGNLAGSRGYTHGFMVWATSLMIGVVLTGMAISSTISAATSAAGSILSGLGNATTVAMISSGDSDGMVSDYMARFDMDIGSGQMSDETRQLLRDTEAPSLQPQFLERQMQGASNDVSGALRQLVINPGDSEQIMSRLGTNLQNRLDTIGQDVDRDAAVNALVSNTDMSRTEAETAVDNWIGQFQEMRLEAQNALNDAQTQFRQIETDVRQAADEAASAIAKSALIAFFALLIGAAVALFAGAWGQQWREGRFRHFRREKTLVKTEK